MSRPLDSAVSWLQRQWRAIRARARRVVATVAGWVRRTRRLGSDQVHAIRDRHSQRLADDPSYSRTVAGGAAAVVATIVTHPVVLAMLTAGLSAMLTRPHTSPTAPAHRSFGDEYGHVDDYDSDRVWRPAASARPAWDVFRD